MTQFAQRFASGSGIGELMDDLGQAMASGDMLMLGGGNPASIPEINEQWHKRLKELVADEDEMTRALVNYDTPQGHHKFIEALAEFLSEQFALDIDPGNIAVTNGSQSAFFSLLNYFGGTGIDGIKRKILFPLVPEYIGYADQSVEPDSFIACRPLITETGENRFKYHIDFEALEHIKEPLGAVCVSRPTNPTGNVLTDDEISRLSAFCREREIPLIVDNAYGAPFPHILFKDIKLTWDSNMILSMSLSKLGLPSTRTGIIVASREIIRGLSSINAILNLSTGSLGQVITYPLIRDNTILRLSREVVQPFYREKSLRVQQWVKEAFNGLPVMQHESEGALFLWLWFRDLPITSGELYNRLKNRGVLVIPGKYFFYGLDDRPWAHREQCIRITYSQENSVVEKGIELIAREITSLYNGD